MALIYIPDSVATGVLEDFDECLSEYANRDSADSLSIVGNLRRHVYVPLKKEIAKNRRFEKARK